jgi:hypothetical protein
VLPADSYTGRLTKAGEIRIDLDDGFHSGGYYELVDLEGKKLSWGSLQTFLEDCLEGQMPVLPARPHSRVRK